MNLNAIHKTWSLVDKNTVFSSRRISYLIKALKLVKITFENVSIS